MDSSGWSSVATRTEVVLLRTLQEALRNIERHAGEEGDALLEVSDDGAGFDVDLPTAGYGLVGTRSRLEAEGGVLHLVSSRGAGTTLWAVLPVTATTPEVPDAEPDAE